MIIKVTLEPNKFSKEQLENWGRYERVRKSGRYNMFDPRAQLNTHLNEEDFIFCMENYDELKRHYEARQ